MENQLLTNAPLYYPSGKEWMWDYCIYLGPYTDSKGDNYDLGIYLEDGNASAAIVYGDEPGDYFSGELYPKMYFDKEFYIETLRRAKELNLIK